MKRWIWALAVLALVVACNFTFTVEDYPYCPESDSARARADSVPIGCDVDMDSLGLR